MNVELVLIIHRFHVCAFTYFLKFICNPQTIHMAVSWSFTDMCRAVNILSCLLHLFYLCYCSVFPTLCNPMDCGTPGFSITWSLLKLIDLSSNPSSRWCHPTISSSVVSFSSCLQSFPTSGSFPMSRLFESGGQSTGASASASVLLMNIHGWFPLGLTDSISLLSKEFSRVFYSTTIQKHQFFGTQSNLWFYQ